MGAFYIQGKELMQKLLLIALLLASHMHAMDPQAKKGIQNANTDTQESGKKAQTQNRAEQGLYKEMARGRLVLKNAQGEEVAYCATSGVWMPISISPGALLCWMTAESKQSESKQ
jgi:hypothetical protein